MANGRAPSDPAACVLRPGIRSGVKREFAFALQSQAQIPLSLGRTRSGKCPPAAAAALSRVSKRLCKSKVDVTPEDAASPPSDSPRLVVSSPPSPPMDEDVRSSLEVEDDAMMDDASMNNGSALFTRDDCMLDDAPSPVNPINLFECKTDSTASNPHQLDETGESAVSSEIMVDDRCRLDVELDTNNSVHGLVIVDIIDGSKLHGSGTMNQVNANDTLDVPTTTMPLPILKIAERGFPVKIRQNRIRLDDDSSKKTFIRRFTRSALKVPVIEVKELSVEYPVKMNGYCSHERSSINLDNPMRRVTRSASKAVSESASGDVTSTSSYSSCSEDTKCPANDADSSILTPKNKMELKMSKKITSAKVPTNLRDLLSTGLLEGLPVKYISTSNKHTTLRGIIKGSAILCYCSSCDGSAIVSAYVFEQHAGSTKKHPANFICLSNGKSLHDIVKACSNAPLEMLEATIQDAIGSVSMEDLFTCQNCKGSSHNSQGGKFFLCDSCLESQNNPKTPTLDGNFNTTRLLKTGSPEGPTDSSSKCLSSSKKPRMGRLTRKDLGLHKLVFMNDILPEGTEVGYYIRGKRLLEGYIKESGIYCPCCNSVISPSQFEAHAGQAPRRKPYNNIYTSNGVSLHELSVSLAKDRKASSESDDLCSICADGGNLLLCDLCPRAFHRECVGLSNVPRGDWYCQYCQNLHQREKCLSSNQNAIAAGRVAGVDPIEQIFKRCIRIVTTSETDESSCTLCRCPDFSKSRFDERTVIICDQCEREYHVGCLRDHGMADLRELPAGEWFCHTDCIRIRSALQEFLHHGAEAVPFSYTNIIKMKCDTNTEATANIRWRLLSGKTLEADSKLLLSRAVAIFHESFDPIVEARTGRDLIPSMVYGRSVRDQDYGGMYCPVLILGSCVVTAGILRVMGNEVAELPLVATSREHQGKGYFQTLFLCIERFLASLGVKHLVLPAAEEAKSIWINKFGFAKISTEQLEECLKGAHPTVFQGTSMLHKPVPVFQVTDQTEKQ